MKASAHTETSTVKTAAMETAVKAAMDEPTMEPVKSIGEKDAVSEKEGMVKKEPIPGKERMVKKEAIPEEEMIVYEKNRTAGKEGESAKGPGVRPNYRRGRRVEVGIRIRIWIDISSLRWRRGLRQGLLLRWQRL
jgi:hypothetical protein